MIDLGQTAPDFTLPRDGEGEVTLSDLRPKTVVLYFYPRDNTPGCTTEALDFTARMAEFEAAGAVVLGISKDSVRKHNSFRDKYDLGVALLSDAESDVCERYGVWKEKNMYGKTHMGIERTTVLIDGTGQLREIWRKVKVPGHVDAVLESIKAL